MSECTRCNHCGESVPLGEFLDHMDSVHDIQPKNTESNHE